MSRPKAAGLDEVIDYLRDGEHTLVVWRLDRLGRFLKHPIETITGLESRQIGFKSITEAIDTTTSGGKLIFHIFGALAEFERDIIKERTQAGLTAAQTRGRKACVRFCFSASVIIRSTHAVLGTRKGRAHAHSISCWLTTARSASSPALRSTN